MKKIILILALAAACTAANAQVKSIAAAESAVQKAKADAENPKKNTKLATWLKYGHALIDAYDAPAGNGFINASRQEMQLISNNEKPISVETVTLAGQTWEKEVYPTRNYYYNANGMLGMIEVTKPIYEDALDLAVEAYAKATELDVKKTKTKDIVGALLSISGKYVEDAYTAYTLGDLKKASVLFEKAAASGAMEPACQLDTNSVYNAGFTAWLSGDLDRAEDFFGRCYKLGYYGEGGETFAKLADIAEKKGTPEKGKDYLEEGFQKFPQSQSILVGLINYYITSNGSTDRLFELLGEAKKNEPNNASLYYVEGNICNQLGKIDDAVAAYNQCAQIDPNYAYGYIGLGQLYYNQALKFSEEAQNEMDDAKYMALVEKFENSLKACIEPFEKSLDIIKDTQTRAAVAEYLKNACFRFRTDPAYQEKYNQYSAIAASAQ
ncbi:MAG: tetratricopeptide repeat protein [Bacteroidales bacterium]|nr:tetratricopeptide repeat protein [Bacteroidales bacterium]